MTAKKLRHIESPIVDVASDSLDPSLLTKRPLLVDSMHLNLRLSGESAHFYRYLEKHTPAITDSLRIRDCVRIAAFLVAMKQDRRTVMLTHEDGTTEDLLDHIGAFLPQTRMDTRRRPAAEKTTARE